MSTRGGGDGPVVGLVTEIISPYRVPVLNALNELLDGRLRVFFLSAMAGRAWPVLRERIRFSYEIARGVTAQPGGHGSPVVYVNVPAVARFRRAGVGPLIVGGYNHPEFLWSLLHARTRRQPILLWSESVDASQRGGPARTALKRAAVRACDGWVAPGAAARRQLEFLGADPSGIAIAPNAVDLEFWGAGAAPRTAEPTPMRLLFVGNLLPYKDPGLLLEAMDSAALAGLELDVVGSGRLREALETRARDLGLAARFHGELAPEALRDRYRAADVLVLPSRSEPWGLVLNEGMAAGCVPVASTGAGATEDLVLEGRTGLTFAAGDAAGLRAALEQLAGDPEGRAALSRAAMEHAATFSPERCAAGFVEALTECGWAP